MSLFSSGTVPVKHMTNDAHSLGIHVWIFLTLILLFLALYLSY